jgi:hypothetical protein
VALVLTIGKLGSSAGQLDYYERQVAAGAEDYYAGRGESPGVWIGGGLQALDVPVGSRVSHEAFLGLMEGRHPGDGSQLRRMTRASTVAAIDLTFSAPKSVSVLYAVAGGEMSAALSEAHERAVTAGVGYLERAACFTRRGHGGAVRVAGEGFVAAVSGTPSVPRLPHARSCSRLGIPAGAGRSFRSLFSRYRSGSHDLAPGSATTQQSGTEGVVLSFDKKGFGPELRTAQP